MALRFFGFLLLMAAPAVFSQEVVPASVCELRADPAKFNHKLVRLNATVYMEFESSFLDNGLCQKTQTSVWFMMGGDEPLSVAYCCEFQTRDRGKDVTIEDISVSLRK